jgi:hypothetical protein
MQTVNLEQRVEELETDLAIADARSRAALDLAFKLFEAIKETGVLRDKKIEDFAPSLFANVTEQDDPSYEFALLDEWTHAPITQRPGDAYLQDMQARIRLRKRVRAQVKAMRESMDRAAGEK